MACARHARARPALPAPAGGERIPSPAWCAPPVVEPPGPPCRRVSHREALGRGCRPSPRGVPGASHVCKRTTPERRQAVGGVSMGRGTVATLEPATVQAVAGPGAEARGSVQAPAA